MTALGIHCFVPPYLLAELARRGTLDAGYVDACLRVDTTFRERRGPGRDGGTPPRAGDARWTVHTSDGSERLPGEPVRREGEPATGDEAVDEAAAGITATLDLFRDDFARDSYDAAGAKLLLTVHYGRDYANAFWDGTHLVFGDGDGRVFRRFTRAIDVLAHEFTHAVTEHTAGLVYRGQSGALNESVSDVFAICLKQRVLGQDSSSGSWLIGEEIFVPGVEARGLRDMERPGTAYDDPRLGKDPQPAHLDDYVETSDDNGGVHLNSGIPNRAFVLAARAIGGDTATGAGRVWYDALTSGDLTPTSDFAAFAAVTVAVAGDHADAVTAAWEGVGVTPGRSSTTPSPGEAPRPVAGPVVVRRSGGIVGQVVEGAIDPSADDDVAREVRTLVDRVDLTAAAAAYGNQADRYTYRVRVGDGDGAQEVDVPEGALTDDLRRLVTLVLGGR
ncbi:hypothetical protein GCM10009623_12500 [Nocardioides aestuarii]|uniref:Neutral metalloproteinase n=1 Tax=Nocardioides aestuarii TaxID=252231 RepID=A0ABW4TL31_9ACTN